ncbi:hypothetical protein W97_08610 [Coniosporium apollinis CBS 100218]|uniref:Uncharacterized protein n=1 Tax=Coniosporium apollinis (strain CBS 100218) TaxID=1168221 RepID=R7Z582_CONA1|nr:uncharacterized protein W97_08610 [Coniosporium apollinis CBS 100218]EON69350.1 hypothetical protein W97_08610 [Coniosporium apollinis CBS 100218]
MTPAASSKGGQGIPLINMNIALLSRDPRYIHQDHPRAVAPPLRKFTDSHTDTITSLVLDPLRPNILISGSTDGLVNVFDVSIAEEEDALFQVVNHGSAVHRTGLTPGPLDRKDIYVLGTDETASFHALDGEEVVEMAPSSVVMGDFRSALGCEYAVDIVAGYIAVGSHRDAQHLDLIPLSRELPDMPNVNAVTRLPGAHGEDIVRDIYIEGDTTFTCGEDGIVRAWRPAEEVAVKEERDAEFRSRRERKKGGDVKIKKEGERFKPY